MKPTSDEIRKQDIVDQLTWDDSVDANDVSVSVRNGIAELKGSVPTYATKMAAERDAYLVTGIAAVENKLEIDFPSGIAIPTDTEITGNVESKLIWDSQINATGIKVETTNGVVTLSGVVDSYWEKNLAEDLARNTSGVIDVLNDLAVNLAKSIVDIDVENDIIDAYRRSGLIDEEKINVNVNDGIVHLTGIVPNYLIKRQAYNLAMYTAGVIDVIDDITIG